MKMLLLLLELRMCLLHSRMIVIPDHRLILRHRRGVDLIWANLKINVLLINYLVNNQFSTDRQVPVVFRSYFAAFALERRRSRVFSPCPSDSRPFSWAEAHSACTPRSECHSRTSEIFPRTVCTYCRKRTSQAIGQLVPNSFCILLLLLSLLLLLLFWGWWRFFLSLRINNNKNFKNLFFYFSCYLFFSFYLSLLGFFVVVATYSFNFKTNRFNLFI